MHDNEHKSMDFLGIYEAAKTGRLYSLDESRTYKNTKKFIEDVINDLCKELENEGFEKIIFKFESYIEEKNRLDNFLYSELSKYIFDLRLVEKRSLDKNIELLALYILNDENKVNNDIRAMILDIYDYINLDKVQKENLKNLLEESVESIKDKLYTEIKTIEKEYITILGIFASIVLSFVGGITFTTSVLQNIDKASIFRLALVIEVLGFVLMNLTYILISFILEINDIDKSKYGKYIKYVNKVLLGMTCLTCLGWFFDIGGLKEYISRCLF